MSRGKGILERLSTKPVMNYTQTTTNLDTVKRLYDLFNQRQWQEIVDLYSEKTLVLDPKAKHEFVPRHKDEILDWYSSLERKHPTLKDKILYIEESGNQVYVQYQTYGVYSSGERWQQTAWTIFTMEDWKIKKVATYFSEPE